MSRIQNILDKAERDGTVRRIRSTGDGMSGAGLATVDTPAAAPPPVVTPPTGGQSTAPASGDLAAPGDSSGLVGVRMARGVRLAPTLVAALMPDAVAAEQYRALRTRVEHADSGTPVQMLLITSPGRGEGKSVTACNLALAMAQEFQQRVCLIDANLRQPQVHRLFDVSEAPGLADVLVGRATLADALVAIEDHHLTLLPAGDPAAHPAELLGTVTLRRMLDAMRSQFDRIIIDAPAAAPLADIGILTPLVDSVMLVVRAGATSKPAIQDAVASIEQGKLLGVVLNESI